MTLDRFIAPPFRPVREVKLVEATHHHLSNGVPVHCIRAGQQPVVGIDIVFRRGGTKYEQQPGACFFALKMLSEGTRHHSAYQISSAIDARGAYLQLSPGVDRSSLEVYALRKHVDTLLGLVRDMMTEPTFPVLGLAQLQERQKQQIKVNGQKFSVVASRRMKSVLFGEHAYGRSLTEAAVDTITRQHLVDFYTQRLLSNWEVILSGDVTEEVLDTVDHHLGSIPIPDQTNLPPVRQATFLPVSKNNLIERPDGLQSSIRLGLPLFAKNHSDYHGMRVVNTILGGYFGSRLMRNIREEKGLTYGISSGMITLEDGGYLVIGADVKKPSTQLALDEIYKEIDRLRQQPVGRDELGTVRNYLAGRLLNSVDTPFALAEKFKNIYLYGLTYDFYQNYLKTLDAITSGELQTTAQRHLLPDLISEIVVGGYV